jgi:fucose 4-O-acetylase-like acetyltransferase
VPINEGVIMSSRFQWVDQSKGIGIVLVVIGHIAAGLYNSGIEVSGTGYDLIMNLLYSFHMPLFFFLSGLFLIPSISKRGALHTVSSKVDSVVYPYVVWSILQGTIQVLLSKFTNSDTSLVSVFQLWTPKGQFWFLYILFFSFVLSSLLIRFVSDRFLELVLVAALLLYLNSKSLNFIFMGELFFQNYVFFVGGGCILQT